MHRHSHDQRKSDYTTGPLPPVTHTNPTADFTLTVTAPGNTLADFTLT